MEEVGVVFRYFAKPMVAAVRITKGSLKVGDNVRIKGATTDFEQEITSMQIDLKPVQEVSAGAEVGLKVMDKVRPNDKVIKL